MKDLGVTDLPPLDEPITGGDLAPHDHSRGHMAVPADWKAFLDFAERHFREREERCSGPLDDARFSLTPVPDRR